MKKNKKWSQQEKNELILQILRGNSILEVASRAGINASMLNKWFNLYQKYGYDGFKYIPIGRPRKMLASGDFNHYESGENRQN